MKSYFYFILVLIFGYMQFAKAIEDQQYETFYEVPDASKRACEQATRLPESLMKCYRHARF
jgi:hypothetical protein